MTFFLVLRLEDDGRKVLVVVVVGFAAAAAADDDECIGTVAGDRGEIVLFVVFALEVEWAELGRMEPDVEIEVYDREYDNACKLFLLVFRLPASTPFFFEGVTATSCG